MKRPNPVPSLGVAAFPRRKRSQAVAHCSGARPGPVSMRATTTASCGRAACTLIRPPAGVRFRAFASRVVNTRGHESRLCPGVLPGHGRGSPLRRFFRRHGGDRDVRPELEFCSSLVTLGGGGKPRPARAQGLADGTRRGEAPWRVAGHLEPLPAPCSLRCGLVGMLRPVMERAVPAAVLPLGVSRAWQRRSSSAYGWMTTRDTENNPSRSWRKNVFAALVSRRPCTRRSSPGPS
jgi:hypothetical protein